MIMERSKCAGCDRIFPIDEIDVITGLCEECEGEELEYEHEDFDVLFGLYDWEW